MSVVEIIKVIFYGIVEGITEWLPVSSTGHLILFESFWPLHLSAAFLEMFRVVIQLGAILAVCVVFFSRLNPFDSGKNRSEKQETWDIWKKVIIGCLPAGVLGLAANNYMDAHFYKWQVVAVTLIVYGVAFILIENKNAHTRPAIRSFGRLSYKTAVLIGLFQCLSLVPGTSRSGATILGAMILGVSRTVAAEYSFFMAIPIMLGASLVKLVKYGLHFTGSELFVLFLGMAVAFAVSLFVVRFLMNFIRQYSFKIFGYYRIILGAVVILIALIAPGVLP